METPRRERSATERLGSCRNERRVKENHPASAWLVGWWAKGRCTSPSPVCPAEREPPVAGRGVMLEVWGFMVVATVCSIMQDYIAHIVKSTTNLQLCNK